MGESEHHLLPPGMGYGRATLLSASSLTQQEYLSTPLLLQGLEDQLPTQLRPYYPGRGTVWELEDQLPALSCQPDSGRGLGWTLLAVYSG